MLQLQLCYLHQVWPRLYWACPVVSSLCNSHISHQEVRGQVTGSESVVGGLQQRETGDAASPPLFFTDHQAVGMETPARVQVEVEYWRWGGDKERGHGRKKGKRGRGGEEDVRVEGTQRLRCIQRWYRGFFFYMRQQKFGRRQREGVTDLQ